jgi:hypothetical protein
VRFQLPRGRRAAWWIGSPAVLAVMLAVSLEEVTDSPEPLDPRFYQGGGTSAVGPGPGVVPFSDYDGETVSVRGVLIADDAGGLDLDLWQVDPSVPGSRVHLGKIGVEGPGPFSIEVPVDFGTLQIESFRDQAGDGPTMDDPFGRVECEVGSADVEGLELVLEAGGMGQHHGGPPPGGDSPQASGPEHVEMPPGGEGGAEAEHQDAEPGAPGGGEHVHVDMPPGGLDAAEAPSGEGADHQEAAPGAPGGGEHQHVEAPPGTPGGGGDHVHIPDAQPEGAPPGFGAAGARDPFASAEGPRVRISGTVVYTRDPAAMLDLDIFRADTGGPGGREFVGKQKLSPGAFVLEVPRSYEAITLEVFHDATGDGPSSDDPFASCSCNPIKLRKGDQDGIEIVLE